MSASLHASTLKRELGVGGAVLLGLGSILGTGVFVSLGLAAGIAGSALLLAIVIAGLVSLCNALSVAQLAASHPVSGGTYEYGYHYLGHWLGFTAGWLFLWAKGASAATGALGFAGYLLTALGARGVEWRVAVAVGVVIALTAVVLSGLRRSTIVNAVVVTITVSALVVFVLTGLPSLAASGGAHLRPILPQSGSTWESARSLFQACALMFLAYAGYGRIGTLGEEIKRPRRTIPFAIVLTLVCSMLLYVSVGLVAVGSVGASAFAGATRATAAPLEVVARTFSTPAASRAIAIGAMTAMLGVLLNLILGLSRVLLAMGRRGDMPAAVGRVDRSGRTPTHAALIAGSGVAALAILGDVGITWSLGAFTVLVLYVIMNLASLRLPADKRRVPRWVPAIALVACLSLAFVVEPRIVLAGSVLIVVGLVWHGFVHSPSPSP